MIFVNEFYNLFFGIESFHNILLYMAWKNNYAIDLDELV